MSEAAVLDGPAVSEGMGNSGIRCCDVLVHWRQCFHYDGHLSVVFECGRHAIGLFNAPILDYAIRHWAYDTSEGVRITKSHKNKLNGSAHIEKLFRSVVNKAIAAAKVVNVACHGNCCLLPPESTSTASRRHTKLVLGLTGYQGSASAGEWPEDDVQGSYYDHDVGSGDLP